MPELPEVETIRRELSKALKGKTITDVCVHQAKVIRQISAQEFKNALQGASVRAILRKAKVLIFELSNGKALLVHLKMTGQLRYPGQGIKSRVSFILSDGLTLDFNDQRLFGELRIVSKWQEFPFIRGLGPEPFEITAGDFSRMLEARQTKIKPLLLDQTFIAGVGNLYAAEALFRARIDPRRPATSLSVAERRRLFFQLCATLKEAITHKGSSVDDYVRPSGSVGGYGVYHKVYDRQGKPCLVCKTPIQRIPLAGRGTYFCPRCQK